MIYYYQFMNNTNVKKNICQIFTNNQKPRQLTNYIFLLPPLFSKIRAKSPFDGYLINHCPDVCTETCNTTSLCLSPLKLMNRPLLQSETRSKTSEHHTGTENVQEAAVSEDRWNEATCWLQCVTATRHSPKRYRIGSLFRQFIAWWLYYTLPRNYVNNLTIHLLPLTTEHLLEGLIYLDMWTHNVPTIF